MSRTNRSHSDRAGRALRALSLVLFLFGFSASAASCGDSTSGHPLSKGCSINSDCDCARSKPVTSSVIRAGIAQTPSCA